MSVVVFSDPPSPEVIVFDVRGVPVGQGAHRVNRAGKIYEITKDHGTWRQELITTAEAALPEGFSKITSAVEVTVTFTFPRLKSHYHTGKRAGELREDAPLAHTTSPDLDHLERTLGDALQLAGVLRNDAQIACWSASKVYGDHPGATIMITEL